MIMRFNMKLKICLILIFFLIFICFFLYDTFWLVRYNIEYCLSLDSKKTLLKELFSEILKNEKNALIIIKVIKEIYPEEAKNISNINSYILFLKYIFNFLDIDFLRYRIGVVISTKNCISFDKFVADHLQEFIMPLEEILIDIILKDNLHVSLYELLAKMIYELDCSNSISYYYYEIFFQIVKK